MEKKYPKTIDVSAMFRKEAAAMPRVNLISEELEQRMDEVFDLAFEKMTHLAEPISDLELAAFINTASTEVTGDPTPLFLVSCIRCTEIVDPRYPYCAEHRAKNNT